MSAFSRGCMLRHFNASQSLRTAFSLPKSSPRFFSVSPFNAAKSTRRKVPTAPANAAPPKSRLSIPISAAKPATYQSFAQTLANKSNTTLLYQAPSHTLFMLSSYGTGLFCFALAAGTYWTNYIQAPDDLPKWVPYTFTVVSFMFAGFGAWLCLGPARVIRSISAIPKSMNSSVGIMAKSGETLPDLQIEVVLRKMLPIPFFPARKMYIRPSEIELPAPLIEPIRELSGPELRAMRIQEDAARKAELEYERSHLMTAPFRHMSRAFFNMFTAMGRTWTRDGFMKVKADHSTYKLDIQGGWALDGGKALERLVNMKPKGARNL